MQHITGVVRAQFNPMSHYVNININAIDIDDEQEAVRWHRKAAEQGDASAQNSLAACYAHGTGVKKDEQEAVEWYRKADKQGYGSAQFYLAVHYQYGTGVE